MQCLWGLMTKLQNCYNVWSNIFKCLEMCVMLHVFLALQQGMCLSISIVAWKHDEVFCWTELLSFLLFAFCRCISCRDDVVTIAAKLKEKRQEKDGKERADGKHKYRTKSSAGGRKNGEGIGGPEQRINRRWNADVNLLSLHPLFSMWQLICLSLTQYNPGASEPPHRFSPAYLCLASSNGNHSLCWHSRDWQLYGGSSPSPEPPLLLITSMKTYPHLSLSNIWVKLGGQTSLSLIRSFAGTLLNVNFCQGCVSA